MSAVPPSGEQIELEAGGYRATVVEVGAGLRELTLDGRPLLDGYLLEAPADSARGQLLIPWPNRVDAGRYEWEGAQRQLDLSEPSRGNAIHGLARWDRWRIERRSASSAQLSLRLHARPGYPHVLDLQVIYDLSAPKGLAIEVTATNVGASAAPYGLGMHPYLRPPGGATIDGCELTVPAERWLPTDERGIPTGPAEPVAGTQYDFRQPRALGAVRIDNAYTELARDERGHATMALRDPTSGHSVSLWVDESVPWLEVFTGDHLRSRQREGLGAEPMTCPPNGFVSGTDLTTLAAGESHVVRFGLSGS